MVLDIKKTGKSDNYCFNLVYYLSTIHPDILRRYQGISRAEGIFLERVLDLSLVPIIRQGELAYATAGIVSGA